MAKFNEPPWKVMMKVALGILIMLGVVTAIVVGLAVLVTNR